MNPREQHRRYTLEQRLANQARRERLRDAEAARARRRQALDGVRVALELELVALARVATRPVVKVLDLVARRLGA